jgi:hypothetical protein
MVLVVFQLYRLAESPNNGRGLNIKYQVWRQIMVQYLHRVW